MVDLTDRGRRRLQTWFDEGRLMRPRSMPLGWVDLSRALALHCGGLDDDGSADLTGARTIAGDVLAGADHLVLVLVDGMGDEQVSTYVTDGPIARHRVGTLQSVFPASTAPAVTSLATGVHPSRHGVPAWWVELTDWGLTAEVLPFCERFTRRPLEEFGCGPETVFPVPSLVAGYQTRSCAVTLLPYVGSATSWYTRGGTTGIGYDSLEDGVDAVVDHVAAAVADGVPSYTYWYLPQYDKICHVRGVAAEPSVQTLLDIDEAVAALVDRLDGRARVVVTADHGQVDVRDDRTWVLEDGHELLYPLAAPPSGEPSVPVFRVRPDHEAEFVERFEDCFGEALALLSVDDAETLELFGPGPLAPVTRQRLGTFVALGPEATALYYAPSGTTPFFLAGVHGGMTTTEMVVPLAVFG